MSLMSLDTVVMTKYPKYDQGSQDLSDVEALGEVSLNICTPVSNMLCALGGTQIFPPGFVSGVTNLG